MRVFRVRFFEGAGRRGRGAGTWERGTLLDIVMVFVLLLLLLFLLVAPILARNRRWRRRGPLPSCSPDPWTVLQLLRRRRRRRLWTPSEGLVGTPVVVVVMPLRNRVTAPVEEGARRIRAVLLEGMGVLLLAHRVIEVPRSFLLHVAFSQTLPPYYYTLRNPVMCFGIKLHGE